MRSSASASASAARHQRRMSPEEGAVRAFSMRDVLAWCQPHPLHCRRVGGVLRALRRAVAGEVVPPDEAVVEQPEVVAGQGDVGGAAARQPPHLFAGRDVREGAGVLVADVLAGGLGHDAGPADDDAAAYRLGDQVEPRAPPGLTVGRVVAEAGTPFGERALLLVDGVDVPHLQVHGGPFTPGQEVSERGRHIRGHRTPS